MVEKGKDFSIKVRRLKWSFIAGNVIADADLSKLDCYSLQSHLKYHLQTVHFRVLNEVPYCLVCKTYTCFFFKLYHYNDRFFSISIKLLVLSLEF